jgi:hypothetical protein
MRIARRPSGVRWQRALQPRGCAQKTRPVEINLKAMPTRFRARHTSGGGSPAGHDPKAPPAGEHAPRHGGSRLSHGQRRDRASKHGWPTAPRTSGSGLANMTIRGTTASRFPLDQFEQGLYGAYRLLLAQLFEPYLGQRDELAIGVLLEIGLVHIGVVTVPHALPEGQLDRRIHVHGRHRALG